jgi:uroporphyrinogen-III decarboxylase
VSNEKAVFHLVDRITFGPRLADLEDALALGYDAYLKRQLAPRSIDDAAVEARVGRLDTLMLTPADIAENVRRNLAAFMPGGGYVFANVHNIQGDVPPENVEALFDAAYEYGFYD